MSYAFSGVSLSKWNDEVIEYLASKFNTITPRFMVLSKSVFINAALAKFDNVSFVINGACDCLELSFTKVDAEKMEPVIQEILNWDLFAKHSSRFYAMVDKDISRSVLFNTGRSESPNAYKKYFYNREVEIFPIKKK